MLNVALGDEDEEFIRRQVESGQYENAADVVRAGLRLLEDESALNRWIDEELPSRYDAYLNDPAQAIPAATVRARFEEKRRRDGSKAE
jgi:antitoxin ParD1/3/4